MPIFFSPVYSCIMKIICNDYKVFIEKWLMMFKGAWNAQNFVCFLFSSVQQQKKNQQHEITVWHEHQHLYFWNSCLLQQQHFVVSSMNRGRSTRSLIQMENIEKRRNRLLNQWFFFCKYNFTKVLAFIIIYTEVSKIYQIILCFTRTYKRWNLNETKYFIY